MRNFKPSMFITLAVFMSSVNALADGWTTPGKVTYINVGKTGVYFILSTANNCAAGNGGGQYYVSWADNPGAKQIYAALLTAFETGAAASGAQNLVAVFYTCTGLGGTPGGADVQWLDMR